MKASETNVLKFMEGEKQFQIPVYQREYKWEIYRCEELLRNIFEIVNKEIENHFISSVVYQYLRICIKHAQPSITYKRI